MPDHVLAIFSARCDSAAKQAVGSGSWPRKDFLELADALDADVIDYDSVEQSFSGRLVRRVAGMASAQAWLAFTRRRRYVAIFCDGEHIGLPLALLLRCTRRRPRLVMLGHLLTTRAKRRVFRLLRPQAAIDSILVHGALQQQRAVEELELSRDQVALIPYQVDCSFWLPCEEAAAEPVLCAAGLEYRDYGILIAAATGLHARVVLAVGRRWSRHSDATDGAAALPNIEVTALDYVGLRGLYARSRFVVVPLREIDNPAGITSILEAMAMARAVIVSATQGQRDVVRGRLCTAEGVTDQILGGPAAFGISGPDAEAETGLYVPPGDAAALRRAIDYLLDHPDEAAAMGAAGRRLVEQYMDLDEFVGRISTAVQPHGAGTSDSPEAAVLLGSSSA